ncbi:MAG: Wzz/FepE/Etk N-terminal domain-containing protein [Candidatus Binataceae bacterium]
MAEPELRLRREPRIEDDPGDHGPIRSRDDDYVDLRPYLEALAKAWRTIALVTALAAVATAVLTGLILPKWYRASATIRPVAQNDIAGRISGLVGGLGGGLGGLAGMAGGLGGAGASSAKEYIAILTGFRFNLDLAGRHDLRRKLLPRSPGILAALGLGRAHDPDWVIYREQEKRFECEYSIRTENLTLYYEAKNRAEATRVLGYYIDDLRELLKTREVRDAKAAVDSLEDEASTTGDAMLRAQLYELAAKQVERMKMAQVDADFAFRVLDPPAASDKPYRPQVMLDTFIAAFLAAMVTALAILLRSAV